MSDQWSPVQIAQAELRAEQFRATVEAEKARLRARLARPWWHVLIPFTVDIKRREP